ncbi:MAG TPA: hypothetical protein VJR94_12835 [Candidatus Nitrosocosmicus sp.]|nr:hypothetical protein [Candidatus Nitrosocosmicus sp.]
MEGLDNNNDNNSNIIKKFLLEISGKFKTSSTVEFSNYEEALESFNQHSKSGKNLILYEIHKSSLDGSLVKKVPVLNTSKHAERMRILEEEEQARENSALKNELNTQSSQQSSSSKQRNKMTFANMKFKIIILAAVVGGLILILFLLDILASGGGSGGSMAGHFIGYDTVQNFVQASINEDEINHRDLVSIFFLL